MTIYSNNELLPHVFQWPTEPNNLWTNIKVQSYQFCKEKLSLIYGRLSTVFKIITPRLGADFNILHVLFHVLPATMISIHFQFAYEIIQNGWGDLAKSHGASRVSTWLAWGCFMTDILS